jgi:hypothetical protein
MEKQRMTVSIRAVVTGALLVLAGVIAFYFVKGADSTTPLFPGRL